MSGIPRFNPRSREGSDIILDTDTNKLNEFQSTLPRGERLRQIDRTAAENLFQSTLPRGERQLAIPNDRIVLLVSIHAPARGATIVYQ